MASMTLAQARLASRNALVQGVIGEILDVDVFWSLLPMVTVPGGRLTYNRELTEAQVKWHTVGATSARAQATWTLITVDLALAEGTAEVDDKLRRIYKDTNNLMAVQVMLKGKALFREWQQKLIIGSSGGGAEPDGLINLIPSGQQVDTAGETIGNSFSLGLVDEVLTKVTANDGRVDALLFGDREILNIQKIKRTLGGANFNNIQIPNPVQPNRPFNVELYRGIPMLRNTYITATETLFAGGAKSRFYAVSFGENVGVTGLIPDPIDDLVEVGPPFQDMDEVSLFQRVELFAGNALYSTKAAASGININATFATL